jgi:hypothetical protein
VPNLSITIRNLFIAVPPPPTAAAVSTAAEGAARAGSRTMLLAHDAAGRRMMLRASCSAPAHTLASPWPRFPTPASASASASAAACERHEAPLSASRRRTRATRQVR